MFRKKRKLELSMLQQAILECPRVFLCLFQEKRAQNVGRNLTHMVITCNNMMYNRKKHAKPCAVNMQTNWTMDDAVVWVCPVDWTQVDPKNCSKPAQIKANLYMYHFIALSYSLRCKRCTIRINKINVTIAPTAPTKQLKRDVQPFSAEKLT